MKKGLSALLLASLLCASSGCQQNQKEVVNEYNIVPMPNQMTPQEGRFQLSNKYLSPLPVALRKYKPLQIA